MLKSRPEIWIRIEKGEKFLGAGTPVGTVLMEGCALMGDDPFGVWPGGGFAAGEEGGAVELGAVGDLGGI